MALYVSKKRWGRKATAGGNVPPPRTAAACFNAGYSIPAMPARQSGQAFQPHHDDISVAQGHNGVPVSVYLFVGLISAHLADGVLQHRVLLVEVVHGLLALGVARSLSSVRSSSRGAARMESRQRKLIFICIG